MATLSRKERTDHFNLSHADKAMTEKLFREVTLSRKDKILEGINKRRKSLGAHGTISTDIAFRSELEFDIEKILNGESTPNTSNASLFFSHFFVHLYAQSSETEKEALLNVLVGALNDNQGLWPIYAELEVGFSYLRKGVDVTFNDIAHSNKKNHDLLIHFPPYQLAIEVKAIGSESGIPVQQSIMNRSIDLIANWSEKNFAGPNYFLIDVTFKNEGSTSYKEAEILTNELLATANDFTQPLENSFARISAEKTSKEALEQLTIRSIVEQELNPTPGVEPFMGIPYGALGEFLGLRIRFEKAWSPAKAMNAAISKAYEQLPEGMPGLIVLCLTGFLFFNQEAFEKYAKNLLDNDLELNRRLQKRGNKDLLGIAISNPFFMKRPDYPDIFACNPRWFIAHHKQGFTEHGWAHWLQSVIPNFQPVT